MALKTAISIPDELFAQADRLAARLGLSRSALYVRAVKEYLRHQEQASVTERLDAVHEKAAAPLDPMLAATQFGSLPSEKW